MNPHSALGCAFAAAALSLSASAQCASLTTLIAPNNGLSANAQVVFDMTVLNPAGITIDAIDTVCSSTAGTAFTIDVYTCPTTYVGNDLNSAAWTFVGTGMGVSTGNTTIANVDLSDFTLAPGSYGIALNATTGGFRYTNGTGSNQQYSNADLQLDLGLSHSAWWGGTTNTPRVWNGTIYYNCAPNNPLVYCTAGTSTNGCVPALTASAQPSASFASPCVMTAANIEGQKSGMIFYGINNAGFSPLPWSPTSSSFFCVKSPVQRSLPQNSGGTLSGCDGQLQLDWNAFHAAFPGSLGAPFSAGGKVYAQAWYRDPPASRTTNLSDAVELTLLP